MDDRQYSGGMGKAVVVVILLILGIVGMLGGHQDAWILIAAGLALGVLG